MIKNTTVFLIQKTNSVFLMTTISIGFIEILLKQQKKKQEKVDAYK